MKQHTIGGLVSFSGEGLHTGKEATVTLHPAPVNHSIKFKRTDVEPAKVILADPNKVSDTNRSTTIQSGTVKIRTVEHLLSALSGLCIDNVLIEIDGEEVPILNGNAAEIVSKIKSVGIQEQEAEREYLHILEPVEFSDPETGAELVVLPADKFEATVMLNYQAEAIQSQFASLKRIEDYEKEIAASRTFVLLSELEMLADQELIKGGSLENAVVFVDKEISQSELDQLAEKLGKPTFNLAKANGTLSGEKLQFANEPARHKLLDLIGDLALVNKPIKGKVIATGPGHRVNVEFAKMLRKLYQEQKKLKGKPIYDPTKKPLYNTVEIEQMLPHRHPFLLVDKIIELSEKHVVGIKNVTYDEPFFKGHFPGNPVMPGVLQIEALAQCGGILALSLIEDPGDWDTYFIKIDNTRFKNKVVPGDTLILKMELLSPIRRGLCHMQGTAYVGNQIVSEGELTAQIIKGTPKEG